MLNRQGSRFQITRQWKTAIGFPLTEEGQALVVVDDGGEAKVRPSTGVGTTEVFAGIGFSHVMIPTSLPLVKDVQASGVNLVLPQIPISGQLRITNLNTGTDLTIVAGAPATGQAQWSAGTGVTLHADQTGIPTRVYLRYVPTINQAIMVQGEGMPGNLGRTSIQGMVSVATKGTYATSCYSAGAYVAGAAVKLGANGFFTSSAGTGTVVPNCVVGKVPNVGQPYLVLELGLV